jgi:hypothetical protein
MEWKSVYRVNWLRARARHARWEEELQLIPKEMEWTTLALGYYEQKWRKIAERYKQDHTR